MKIRYILSFVLFLAVSLDSIAGDFMTRDYSKSRAILKLNLLKGNVKPELEKEYEEGLV